MISAVVLVHNEIDTIKDCLKSLSFSDEIIVVEDNADEKTIRKITGLKELQKKILMHHRKLNGDFAAQRNFAMTKASGDWVLFVDADEVVPQNLAREIISETNKNNLHIQGYFLRRTDHFFNRQLNYGETSRVRLLRLARNNAGRWERKVHEVWKINGNTQELIHPLEHWSHPSIHQFLSSINIYTSLDAKHLMDTDKVKFSLFRVVFNPAGKFLQNYFLRLGFLDGLAGFVMAFMMSLHSLIVRVKLYDLSRTS